MNHEVKKNEGNMTENRDKKNKEREMRKEVQNKNKNEMNNVSRLFIKL